MDGPIEENYFEISGQWCSYWMIIENSVNRDRDMATVIASLLFRGPKLHTDHEPTSVIASEAKQSIVAKGWIATPLRGSR